MSIECPVAEFNVSIVFEPVAEKTAPATEAHCRVCLQYTLAEAMVRGELGRGAHADAFRTDPEILALARRVTYRVESVVPAAGPLKGAVTMTLADGRVLSEVEEYNRGSAEESDDRRRAARTKLDDNAGSVLDAAARERLAGAVAAVESMDDAGTLTGMTPRAGPKTRATYVEWP